MKRTQQLTADNLLAWKRTEAELRREFQTQEAALQKTLGKLRAELARVTEEARENREKSHKLQASLTTAESTVKVSLNPKTADSPSLESHAFCYNWTVKMRQDRAGETGREHPVM